MKYVLLVIVFFLTAGYTEAQQRVLKPQIGIAENMDNDSLLAAAGYTCMVESIGRRFSPRTVPDAAFQKNLLHIAQLPIPIYSVNLFIPADLKLVGPAVNEKAVLAYADSVMNRLHQANIRHIVWGSGGARRIPEGFDKKVATEQMISIAKKIAKRARKYHIVIFLENLNSTETNFINTVEEALYIVRKVNHPNLRLNADIYHMLKEGESPDVILKTGKYLAYVEIAEKEQRTAPGVTGTDFRPYLQALQQVNYHGKIVIEGQWKKVSDIAVPAFQYLQRQINEVYGP
ncbi:MAG TPA: sugar phosphate isomerase/epimerase family protein [Saprospiraceae bacterium]|nr:sugar phosphate isomerase/epimerase family protein [Saprospiraceae bacterium]HPI08660.1 sugar phosphate isomerase/epimerase family protein [Saprospiraceae bacterium]